MASVIQCDVCGKIREHKEACYLVIYDNTSKGTLGNKLHDADLCSECYEKVCKLLNLRSKIR